MRDVAIWAVGVASYPWLRWGFRFYKCMFAIGTPDDEAFIERVPFSWPFERERAATSPGGSAATGSRSA